LVVPSNDAPSAPDIDGTTSGTPGIEYDYSFVATDPNDDDVLYFIEWGDGTTTGWIGPYASGQEIVESHSWSSKGSFTITAKAKDTNENEGLPGTLDVSIPRTRNFQSRLILRFSKIFFEKISILIKILS